MTVFQTRRLPDSSAALDWQADMAHHEQMEAEFFERVRTGRQAELEPEAHRAHWESLQEVRVCGVHGERPVSQAACVECTAGAMSRCETCGTLFPAKRKTRKYCGEACKKRAQRVPVTVTAQIVS